MRCVLGVVPRRRGSVRVPDLGNPLWSGDDGFRLIGAWPQFMVRTASGRSWRAALLGWSGADGGLAPAAQRYARTGDVGALAGLGASCITIVATHRQVAVLGDLAGQRPVYYRSVPGGLLLCSSARLLARIVGAGPSAPWLAARVLASDVPEAWASGAPFEGIHAVPAGAALVATPDGHELRGLAPLDRPRMSVHAGGTALRAALTGAIECRTRAVAEVSTDLSGGLDSTGLTLLAARAAPVDALTLTVDVGAVDDSRFAAAAATADARVRHNVADVPSAVDPYAELTDAPRTDEPYDDAPVSARLRWWCERAAQLGGRIHLSGDGGDAALVAPPSYLLDLLRRRRWSRFVRHAYGWARLRHRPPSTLIRAAARAALLDRHATMARLAAQLRAGRVNPVGAEWERLLDWTPWPAAAAWTTARARHLAADAIGRATESADTTSFGPGDGAAMAALRVAGRVARLREEIWVDRGVELQAPYFDDDVVRACFAVPADVRTSPEQVKPLLRAALRCELPAVVRNRRTKGDYTPLVYRGLRRQAATLRALFDGSCLAELGLVIDGQVRQQIDQATRGLPVRLGALDQIIGAEVWLRGLRGEEPVQ